MNKKAVSIITIGVFVFATTLFVNHLINSIPRIDLPLEPIDSEPSQVLSLESDEAYVTRIVDGDTIVIDTDNRVRYIGIDTPERPHSKNAECFALNSHLKNSDMVLGKKVRLEKDVSDTDRYGRLLRYVYVDDVFVNHELVAQGYALAKEYPPDTKHASLFKQAELEAREKQLGIWKYCYDSEIENIFGLEEVIELLY